MNLRILFIHKFSNPDYLSDSIYHGLIDLGCEVHTIHHPKNLHSRNLEYQHCFNLYGKLKSSPIALDGIFAWQKLHEKYYDFVIFGNIRDSHKMFWTDRIILSQLLKKEQIHFLDGEDDDFILTGLSEYGILWKRELKNNLAEPIGFSIPECQLALDKIVKEKFLGTVIPGDMSTYIFQSESEYNQDYQKSYYGLTYKKAGWDCMRHYEILANRCIPLFPDLEKCPEMTMTHFPKKIILEVNKYSTQGIIHPQYEEINEELFEYTKMNLTTKAMARKIIEY